MNRKMTHIPPRRKIGGVSEEDGLASSPLALVWASGLITLLWFYQRDLAVVGKSLNFARSYLFHLKNADGNSLTHKIFMNFTWANACTACLEPGKTQELLPDIFLFVMRMLNAHSLCTSNWCLPHCTSETIFSLWVFSFLRGWIQS